MVRIILIEKNGTVKGSKINNFNKENLYKKCKLKTDENFDERITWKMDDETNVTLFCIHFFPRKIELIIDRGPELPWQTIDIPLTPKRGVPPCSS